MSNKPVRGNAGGAGNNQPPASAAAAPTAASQENAQNPNFSAEQLLPHILSITSHEGYNKNLNRAALRGTSRYMRNEINAYTRQKNTQYSVGNAPPLPANPMQELVQMIVARDRDGIDRLLAPGPYRSGLFKRERGQGSLLTPAILDTPVNSSGNTALYYAVAHNDEQTVKQLLARGANPNGHALAAGTPLAEQGARVSAPDPRALGFPTTNLAAFNGNLPILQALVAAGGNINAWAGMGGGEDPAILVSLECALLGLEYRRGVYTTHLGNKYRYNRQTLQSKFDADPELFQKYINIFYYALDNGGDVNTRGMGMRTPLRSAVEIAILDPPAIWMVQDLLNRGADPDIRENMGDYQRTTREVVQERGTPELQALFADVPQGGYPPGELPAAAPTNGQGGAAGGAASNQGGGARRRRRAGKTVRRRKGKKGTRRH